ncbi:MAG: phosphate ABC transporter permease PstA [Hyphomicrobiales bacterium]|nr:phosphate ABC transporter permease PstA [Hyphomicrobiales bacterium]
MTDITSSGPVAADIHTSPEARSRLSKRYASEGRFKAYGLVAVFIAASFLVLLLSTIIIQAIPAFTYHYVTLDMNFDQETLDPNNTGDPDEIRRANFNTVVRDSLRDIFPGVAERSDRRLLSGVVTSAANIQVRDMVQADPSLVGQNLPIAVPLSDFADLYMKGMITGKREIETAGQVGPTGTEGEIEVFSQQNDFLPILQRVKDALAATAAARRSDAAGRERSLEALQSRRDELNIRLETANDELRPIIEEELAATDRGIASVRNQIESFVANAEALEARAAAANVRERLDTSLPSYLVKINNGVVKINEVDSASVRGQVLIPLDSTAQAAGGEWSIEVLTVAEENRKINDQEIAWVDKLNEEGRIERRFNTIFFTSGASREPEQAGIWGAVVGSFWTMVVTLAISFPLGVAAAIYLEEFAPKNRLTQIIEVNINNLAAVPSIVFGLLGLAVFLNTFGLPRSAPVAGGMVIALMTLPTIIIASRAALRAVPPSIREAALGMGASKIQSVFHHVLPLAMPGIMTGTIIGMAQALGESAPLLMIGMVAFVVDIPTGPLDAATVLPVQIYMWSDFPEPAFQQKTAAAILILLGFLVIMNALAVILRKRFERRW